MKIVKNFFAKINANHQFKLGIEEHRKGQIDNAIEMFSRAIKKYEKHIPSLYSRGSLYIDIVRWDKALLDLEKVKLFDINAENIDFLMGICYCGLGNFDKGLRLLEEQINKTPLRPEPYWNRALAYKNIDKNEEALIDINKAIDILRRDFKLFCIKAEILENLERNDEAVECYNKAIEIEKLPGESLLHKIEFLKRNNKLEEALVGMNKMIEQYPYDGHLFLKRGVLNELSNKMDLARLDYQSALTNGVSEAKEKIKNIA
jgi:tetratricopeptide (TPR) repeat protein